jgi:D-alanyl-D-alanine carboxypeptidase (penicillin-binding protein 5/6)
VSLCHVTVAQEENQALMIRSQSAILIDASTGTVLFAKDADTEIPPASMAKLMTIHIALSEVYAGRASLEEIIALPPESWSVNQLPHSSLMFLGEGQTVSLNELLLGLAVPSGNDAAVAIALRFAPTVAEFADRMTTEARLLGLEKTIFVDASGRSPYNRTTAEEFAMFCRFYIEKHPEALEHYHSVRRFAYPMAQHVAQEFKSVQRTIVQNNGNNSLLSTVTGTDGLKTGFIDESGYNVAITAERDGTRFIAVIMGGNNPAIRNADAQALIEYGFEHFRTVYPTFEPLEPARVWLGNQRQVAIGPAEQVVFTAALDRVDILQWRVELESSALKAPLETGSHVGELVFYDEYGDLERIQLYTQEVITKGNILRQILDSITLFFRKIFAPRV